MPTYVVRDKASGQERYRYTAVEPIEFDGFEFDQFDHVAQLEAALPSPSSTSRPMTKLAYLRLFTQDERIAIRAAAASSAVLTDYLELLNLADVIDTQDTDTRAAVQMLGVSGLIAPQRVAEILDGA